MHQVARVVALVLCCAGAAAADQQTFQGRRLDEALRLLQQAGLPIVFSSGIVTPTMRVGAEPRATTPRQQLDDLLEPHGLKATEGPGGVILVVRAQTLPAPRVTPSTPSTPGNAIREAKPPSSGRSPVEYSDRVTVTGSRDEPADSAVPPTSVDGSGLQSATSVLQGGGLEAVHAMPGVAAVDDFRTDFSVRGSPYRQIGVVVDGVATHWLQHSVSGRDDAGSVSMFGSDILERATLETGAYPRRYDDALGADLVLTVKEGSRDSTRFRVTAGGTTVGLSGDGPIGSDGRGSWIAGVRNSYRSWPPGSPSRNDVGFAFADVHGKLVYDISPAQQFSVTALGGRSTLDTVDEAYTRFFGDGTDGAGLVTVGWRSTFGAHTVIRQQLFYVGQDLVSTLHTGQLADRSSNRALGYRAQALHPLWGGLLEAGTEVSRLSGVRDLEATDSAASRDAFGATWATHAAYANFTRAASSGLSFELGARASESTLVHQRALAPWALGAWRFEPGWTLSVSAGASRQFPDLDAALGLAGSSNLLPEQATHVDVGVEEKLAGGLRWQATLFNRIEHDGLRPPDLQPRLVQGRLVAPPGPGDYRNSLHGLSRGLDLLVAGEGTARLSGWMSYTYALTRQTDVETLETFWSDFDQRHVFNAAGRFRIGDQSSAGLVLRAASGVPIPGYFALSNGTLVAGEHRNEERLPPYLRLDARLQRTFFSSRHPVILFGEVVNALNRRNLGTADGFIQPVTGNAIGFSRPLLPRRASLGIEIDLSR